jgi:uncharacterized membrane protein HdeD (DUF308 family)
VTSESLGFPTGLRPLRQALGDYWLLFLLRGVAAILFGVLSLFWPEVSLTTLVLLYGAFVLVDGVSALVAGFLGKTVARSRWWLLVVGLLGILAGVVTFVWPGMTTLILLYFVAGWAVSTGVFQIVGAIRVRKEIDNEWLLIVNGALCVLFGVALFVMPGAGALALIWMIAAWAILYGILMIGFALRVRQFRDGRA